MSTLTIMDNDYVTLWYHPESKIVHHQFHRFTYGEQLRSMLDKGVEIFKQYGANKWLSDDVANSTLSKEDGEWAINDWSPRVFGEGWKYWAVVVPDKIVGKANMNRFMQQFIARGLVVRVFEDVDEAQRWLESVE